MRPRFVERLGLADLITATNAGVGFVAVAVAMTDPFVAARIVLLGAILDALDGIVARWRGGTAVGPHLDSLADVATFGVAPAFIVFRVGDVVDLIPNAGWDEYLWILIPAIFVSLAVIRLGLYTAYDVSDSTTEGVQSTLAATLIAAAMLVGVGPSFLLGGTALLSILMVAPTSYPDLRVRDAFIMGAVQGLAIIAPTVWDGIFPTVLLAWALGYLVFAPWAYRRSEGKRS